MKSILEQEIETNSLVIASVGEYVIRGFYEPSLLEEAGRCVSFMMSINEEYRKQLSSTVVK